MARATNGPASRARRKRILQRAKGFRGFRSKLFRYAKDAVYKAWQYEYRDRKKRKGQFRRLWTARISAAVHPQGFTFSRFVEGLDAAGVELDRKSLSELAIANPEAFQSVIEQAKVGADLKERLIAALHEAGLQMEQFKKVLDDGFIKPNGKVNYKPLCDMVASDTDALNAIIAKAVAACA